MYGKPGENDFTDHLPLAAFLHPFSASICASSGAIEGFEQLFTSSVPDRADNPLPGQSHMGFYPLIFANTLQAQCLDELVSSDSREFAESSGSWTKILIFALELFSNAIALILCCYLVI